MPSVGGTRRSPPDVLPADTVLLNGHVLTVEARDRIRKTVAIRAGPMVCVGTDAGERRYVDEQTELVDLGGRMLMLGLHDGHVHVLAGGRAARARLRLPAVHRPAVPRPWPGITSPRPQSPSRTAGCWARTGCAPRHRRRVRLSRNEIAARTCAVRWGRYGRPPPCWPPVRKRRWRPAMRSWPPSPRTPQRRARPPRRRRPNRSPWPSTTSRRSRRTPPNRPPTPVPRSHLQSRRPRRPPRRTASRTTIRRRAPRKPRSRWLSPTPRRTRRRTAIRSWIARRTPRNPQSRSRMRGCTGRGAKRRSSSRTAPGRRMAISRRRSPARRPHRRSRTRPRPARPPPVTRRRETLRRNRP
ncbi:hypothetical protein QF032_007901 [Streptomyces achromogenes]|nr:hypothetical protein [Streptomyces achromogenes]